MVVARNYSRFREAQRLGGGFSSGNGDGGDPIIARLAHRVYGAGYNSGAAPLTGDGTTKTFSATFVNNSGADIETFSLVFQGWTLRTTGVTDTGNDFDVSGNVEYPIGSTQNDIGTVTNLNGFFSSSDPQTPAVVIPDGASFKVNLSAAVPNGAKYIANLGFAGLRNHARQSELKPIAVAAFGDSIMTNNGGSIYNAALGRCGAYINSIIGTTAATYGANNAANFEKQAYLAAQLGCTHIISNFGTNDFGAGTSLATLQSYLNSMRDLAQIYGIEFVQCTMLPRTKSTNTPVSATLASDGNDLIAWVDDASKFDVGVAYTIAGANETEYNGTKICTNRSIINNTISFTFIGSASEAATGAITIVPWKPTLSAGFMEPYSGFFNPGSDSPRGQFNAWVRDGAFDDFIDWATTCEPFDDAGIWVTQDVDGSGFMPTMQEITISNVISTSRFNSDYDRGNSTIAGGLVQAITGANVGILKTANGNTGGDITVSSAWPNAQAIGDTLVAMPGACWMSDDGTHPRVAVGGFGGQPHLDDVSRIWLDQKLSA